MTQSSSSEGGSIPQNFLKNQQTTADNTKRTRELMEEAADNNKKDDAAQKERMKTMGFFEGSFDSFSTILTDMGGMINDTNLLLGGIHDTLVGISETGMVAAQPQEPEPIPETPEQEKQRNALFEMFRTVFSGGITLDGLKQSFNNGLGHVSDALQNSLSGLSAIGNHMLENTAVALAWQGIQTTWELAKQAYQKGNDLRLAVIDKLKVIREKKRDKDFQRRHEELMGNLKENARGVARSLFLLTGVPLIASGLGKLTTGLTKGIKGVKEAVEANAPKKAGIFDASQNKAGAAAANDEFFGQSGGGMGLGEKMKGFFQSAFGGVSTVAQAMVKIIGESVVSIGGFLGEAIGSTLGGFIKGLSIGLKALGNPQVLLGLAGLTLALSTLSIAIGTAAAIGGEDLEHFGSMMKQTFEGVGVVITSIGDVITGVIDSVGDAVVGIMDSFGRNIEILSDLDAGNLAAVAGSMGLISAAMIAMTGAGAIAAGVDAVGGAVTGLVDNIAGTDTKTPLEKMVELANGAGELNKLGETFSTFDKSVMAFNRGLGMIDEEALDKFITSLSKLDDIDASKLRSLASIRNAEVEMMARDAKSAELAQANAGGNTAVQTNNTNVNTSNSINQVTSARTPFNGSKS